MRIAIVGSEGYIAGFLKEKLQKLEDIEQILKIDQIGNFDVYLNLSKAEEFDYTVLDNIDFVIFTAAISSPDKCATDFDYCWAINVTGTECFIKEALNRKCRVLFFSSDAVFGNSQNEICTETSNTQAKTPYGRMKKAIEDKFKFNDFFKIIRLSYVVSAKDKFVSYCIDCVQKDKKAEVFHPFYRNCVVVEDVVNVVVWFIYSWQEYEPFALNVAGRELVSRVRIADEINRLIEGKLKYDIVHPGEEFYKNRPMITQMESIYMEKYQILEHTSFTRKINNELEGLLSEL